ARNQALARSLEAAVRPGDVVVDLGAGSGLLALVAARQGARKVYAIERSSMATVARRLVAQNGYEQVIEVVQADSFDWQPPERAQVLISETLGFAVFDEQFRACMADARERMLVAGGRIIPERIDVYAAPVSPVAHVPDIGHMDEILGFDFSPLARMFRGAHQRAYVPEEDLLAPPRMLCSVDCRTMAMEAELYAEAVFECRRAGVLAGFALWFVADMGAGITMSSRSPDPEDNHWGQALLGAGERGFVEPGQAIRLALGMVDHRRSFRLEWSHALLAGAAAGLVPSP
ncbi:MAG TPA: 50S ribosomal protein L11 methyltransferase, partial [Haliangium sp.]|nr:50S ribosomal protein L11 methyltransferase [Haliangium sp.]